MSKGTIYIAGPMRGHPFYNYVAFDVAKIILEEDDFNVISPADLDRDVGFDPFDADIIPNPMSHDWSKIPEQFDLRDAIRRDIDAIFKCSHILLLPGWLSSTGARFERSLASFLGLEILEWVNYVRGRDRAKDG